MILLFDLNGTLTDPAGIGEPWDAPALGRQVLAAAVATAMVDALLGSYRPFLDHLRNGLTAEVGRRSLDPGRIEAALERAAALDPFADVPPALERLAGAGHRLAVLTNSGAEGGRRTLAAAGLAERFERILGVDAVHSFKPHPSTYRHALDELAAPAGDVTMVAAHQWDLAGARHAGMRTAWLTRGHGERSQIWPAPDLEAVDLGGVAARIAELA